MTTSEQINEIAAALAKAQGEMGGAVKDSANPFFKSKYADLASVRGASIAALAKNGIAVVQSPSAAGVVVTLTTLLLHTSGQWIRGEMTATAKEDSPQAIISIVTYLRRTSLAAFSSVAPEDDDAEAAQGRGNGKFVAKIAAAVVAPKGFDEWLNDMGACAEEGTERLQKAWKDSKPEYRSFLTTNYPKNWEALKSIAAKVVEQVPA
jgi:hypothetical protein